MAMSRMGWKLTTLALSLPLGYAARKAVAVGWRSVRKADPPAHADHEARWGETLAWAALSATTMAAVELLAARGAAMAWRRVTGGEPPSTRDEAAEPEA